MLRPISHRFSSSPSSSSSISLLIPVLLTLLLVLHPTTVTAALRTPPSSFCKCICASNSTIIALNPVSTSTSTSSSPTTPPHLSVRNNDDNENHLLLFPVAPRAHQLSCSDCTRSFCLSYNLAICKGVAEDQISATCFQRDNLKDELVIYGFLAATLGLLGWAGLRPWVEKLRDRAGFGSGSGLGSGSGFGARAGTENREGRYVPLGEGEGGGRG